MSNILVPHTTRLLTTAHEHDALERTQIQSYK